MMKIDDAKDASQSASSGCDAPGQPLPNVVASPGFFARCLGSVKRLFLIRCPHCDGAHPVNVEVCPVNQKPILFSEAIRPDLVAIGAKARRIEGRIDRLRAKCAGVGLALNNWCDRAPPAQVRAFWRAYLLISAILFWWLLKLVQARLGAPRAGFMALVVVFLTFALILVPWFVPPSILRQLRDQPPPLILRISFLLNYFSLLLATALFAYAWPVEAAIVAVCIGITWASGLLLSLSSSVIGAVLNQFTIRDPTPRHHPSASQGRRVDVQSRPPRGK